MMKLEKDKYIQLCKTEDSIPIFSQPFWLDAVCGEKNWDVIFFEKENKIMASLPYYIKKQYGISYITQPQITQIMGPWIKYPDHIKSEKKLAFEKEVMYVLIEQLEKLPLGFYQQSFNFKFTNWLPFYWKGYSQTTKYTYRIEDISNIDEVYNNFTTSKKRNIEIVQKKNLSILFDLPSKDFYDFHKYMLARDNRKINYSFKIFDRIYTALYQNKCGRSIYLADEIGKIYAEKLFVWDAMNGYSILSAHNKELVHGKASDLLSFETIKYMSSKTRSFDFEGSMIESVEESYSKFGTIQTPYFRIWKIYTKNLFLRFLINTKIE